jgi:hypothetical protein
MGFTVLAGGVLGGSPAAAAALVPVVDPAPVLIFSSTAPADHEFAVLVPVGGQLRALPPAASTGPTTGEVMVENAKGVAIGAYDAPWAADAQGQSLATSYRVKGNRLIQTVHFTSTTKFPVTLDPIYSAVGLSRAVPPLLGKVTKVTVPSIYVYNPALGTLHDYCTGAPDEFPAPAAANADFRGPCARHDLCYGNKTLKSTCDNALRADMYTNCQYYYSWYNPLRPACEATADIYWLVVTAPR